MVIGLAPGAWLKPTGRMFTGDASGDFFRALQADFANQPESTSINDGLTINDFSSQLPAMRLLIISQQDEIDNCRAS